MAEGGVGIEEEIKEKERKIPENVISPLTREQVEQRVAQAVSGGDLNPEDLVRRAAQMNSRSNEIAQGIVSAPTPEERQAVDQALASGFWGEYKVVGHTNENGQELIKLQAPSSDPEYPGEQFSLRVGAKEGINAGLIPDIPAGLDLTNFKIYIRNTIEFLEVNRQNITPELIISWGNNIAAYVGIPASGITTPEKVKIQRELEVRLNLAASMQALSLQKYEEFAVYYSNMNKERWDILKNEVLGASGIDAIHKIETGVTVVGGVVVGGDGQYWRLDEAGRAALSIDLTKAEMIKQIAVTDSGLALPTPDDIYRATQKFEIIENIFHTSGMSSFYAGPVDAVGNLLELQHMTNAVNVNTLVSPPTITQAPNVPGVDTTNPVNLKNLPILIYERNERYWEEKRNYRLRQLTTGTPILFPSDTDPATNMRRLLYFPEELNRMATTAGTGGKAVSLRYAAELYVTTLPQMNGVATLEEFLGPVGVADDILVKKNNTFQYASIIKGAALAATAFIELINEPIRGKENAGDLSKLGENLENLLNIEKEYVKYLRMLAPNILSNATSKLLESTFRYVNGNTSDRKREFPRLPIFGPQTRNAVVNFLGSFMDDAKRQETLRRLNASQGSVLAKRTGQELGGLGWDLLKNFLRIITKS